MAITIHYTRDADGNWQSRKNKMGPMEYVIWAIPDGTPFQIYIGEIGEDNNVTEDYDALTEDAVFHIVETAGGGGSFAKIIDPLGVLKFVTKLISPSQSSMSSSLSNNQADSPNNSLTDRNNKPRPYERSYDICGTVQDIPNDLMTTYKVFNAAGTVVEYGFYDAGRGPLHINAADVTDGDTKVQEITGSSVAIYAPFTSPNNTKTPQLQIGDPIDQGLYITVQSNEVDGQVLKAQNGLSITFSANSTRPTYSGSGVGVLTDSSGDSDFAGVLDAGDTFTLRATWVGNDIDLSGSGYRVISASEYDVIFNIPSAKVPSWVALPSGAVIRGDGEGSLEPDNTYEKTLTDWVSINRIPVERVAANIAAANGMYKDNGDAKTKAAVTVELQYQMLDGAGVPYGPIYTKQGTVSGRSADYTGVTIYANLPTASTVRVRMRRVTNLDLNFEGTVVDEVTYINLYGQTEDKTPHYGNRTTVHSARKQTPRAAEVKQPQLRMIATEMVYKYRGNGIFEPELTPNNQAVQSLIRLLRDPVCGNLDLSVANMDKLLAVQGEVEAYFQSPDAGRFDYTFDDKNSTMQDIISAIAEAMFCTPYRRGPDILLDFDRPRSGPEMVFTHRSKTTASEKWTRTFNDQDTYDSLEYSYIDPDTNVKETIRIPEDGGVNTETYDSKGIRNYQQAYWQAHRRHQKNILKKVTVSFTATEEGVFVLPGRAISVVKGSRVAPQDGYVIAVNGLTLNLSQEVTFKPGVPHSIILKHRDGSVESISVAPGANSRQVIMQSIPMEAPYTGNSQLKTEFSFGDDSRHNAQMMLVTTVDPGDDRTVNIAGYNYSDDFYKYDGVAPFGRAFSDGFDNGFS